MKNCRKKEKLAPYTTFKIGGPAKFFTKARNEKEMIEALKWAREKKLKYFILGMGSNILVSDKGFDGLVIKNEMSEVEINNEEIRVASGTSLNQLIAECTKKSLSGLEFLAGIPSTVGGAVAGNAGAPEKAIGNFVKKVRVLGQDLEIKELTNNECGFRYRQTIIQKNNYFVLSALLKLEKGDQKEIQAAVKNKILEKQLIQPLDYPSAGSVFKNPKEAYAGNLIDKLGLKGKKIGQAQISEKHANFIINLGGATADHVVQLISYIKQQVRDEEGIELREEIKYIGF